MGVYVHDNSWASRRGIVLIAIILFHVLLVWGLSSGVMRKALEVMAPPIETVIVEEVAKDDTPPPPPPPKIEMPPVEVPPPIVDISVPVEASTTALSNVTDKPLPPAPPPVVVAAPVARVSPKLNPRTSQPDSEEYYPPSSKRLGEQGNVVVKSCIAETGKLAEASVQESSSIARLDEAALKYAKALRYVAGTENGKPAPACFSFRVKFQLKD